jgi:FdhD protein
MMAYEYASVSTTRITAGQVEADARDEVAVEEPLELRVEGRPIAVTMRTPGHDDELAIGFLLTEGIIAEPADLLEVNQCPTTTGQAGNVVDVLLRNPSAVDFDRLTRHVFSASSCGLCGKVTIDAIRQRFAPIRHGARPTRAALLALPDRLAREQATFLRTGGLHAAALFAADGRLLGVREDVGRHNAVDKVLGHALRQGWGRDEKGVPAGLLVSGRISFEIVQKALAARIGVIAGISAPTSLAVEFARENGQTLVGFLRPGRLNLYTGEIAL